MVAEIELAQSIQFVLLAMLQSLQEAVAERQLSRDPSVGLRILRVPTGHKVAVAIVSRELEEAADALSRDVRGSEIDGVVAFADVEGSAVHGHGFDGRRNKEVRIGVAVAVSISGKVVRVEEVADLKELGDRLSVVAGNAGGEILRRFDAS